MIMSEFFILTVRVHLLPMTYFILSIKGSGHVGGSQKWISVSDPKDLDQSSYGIMRGPHGSEIHSPVSMRIHSDPTFSTYI